MQEKHILRAGAGWLSLWHKGSWCLGSTCWWHQCPGTAWRGKAVALRGYESGCEVKEAPLPQAEDSADAWETIMSSGTLISFKGT